MNYVKHYNLLIERAKSRIIQDEYCERHHIIPRCLGGSNKKSNLVNLYPEEHFLAHQLLVKINPNNTNLIHAATMMCVSSGNVKRSNNKLYGWLRKRLSKAFSVSQTGSGNSQYGTKWIHNKDLKISKKIPLNESVPTDWEEGRILNWAKSLTPIVYDSCPQCGKIKNSINKFCSHSCSSTNLMANRETIFDLHLEDIIKDYKNGMSIYKCLISRNLCGTGTNHTKLKNILRNL